ncbi:MAG: hypothetical protein AAGA30_12835, partial [Planctomycetota bacterium]
MPTTTKRTDIQKADLTILLVGASARYSAESAGRAGIECLAIDQFSDWDLKQVATVAPFEGDLESKCAQFFSQRSNKVPQFVVLCGGMEKRCSLIRRLDAKIPVLGVPASMIEKMNDPFGFQEFCLRQSIIFPECRTEIPQDDNTKRWLRKPKLSAGGAGIRFAEENLKSDGLNDQSYY